MRLTILGGGIARRIPSERLVEHIDQGRAVVERDLGRYAGRVMVQPRSIGQERSPRKRVEAPMLIGYCQASLR